MLATQVGIGELSFFKMMDTKQIKEDIVDSYVELIEQDEEEAPFVLVNSIMGYMIGQYAEELCLRHAHNDDVGGLFQVPSYYLDVYQNDEEKWEEMVSDVIEFIDYNSTFNQEGMYSDTDYAFRDDILNVLNNYRLNYCYKKNNEMIFVNTPTKEVW